MQTFLPVPRFSHSASLLDYRRLGKQRVEAWQILQCLRGEKAGWRNHPAVKMWTGYEAALVEYGYTMCVEWSARGYSGGVSLERFTLALQGNPVRPGRPPWIGDPAFHLSHRSNLLRKFPEHYRVFWPTDPDDLPYVWPSLVAQSTEEEGPLF